MSAQLLEGKVVAQAVLDNLKGRIERLKGEDITPGLGTILVGNDPASAGYVRRKHETSREVGIASFNKEIPENATQDELLSAVHDFNSDDRVDAYLVQHPVPEQFDFNEALTHMDPAKDADGLHPVNLGKLVLQEPGPIPCTPAGIRELFIHYDLPIKGREVVIIGRGPTLGRPLALLLSLKTEGANAAVTVVHSGVPNLSDYTKRADTVVAAVGRPSIVTPEMVKPGAIVVSGGITWEGKRLVPDVDESVGEVAGWITPRLGGVGPTTVAMLLRNTVEAAERKLGLSGAA